MGKITKAASLRRACGELWPLVRQAFRAADRDGLDGSRKRTPVGLRDWQVTAITPATVRACIGDLNQARAWVEKCNRDLRRLPELPADRRFLPTGRKAHDCLARLLALSRDLAKLDGTPARSYRLVATHVRPDADALAAAWLAERFLFPGEATRVTFVRYDHTWVAGPVADCVLDLGGVYAPELLAFDHKPPAYADRNATCTTQLVWEHLRRLGRPVAHLTPLVAVVREADTIPRRGAASDAVRESKRTGLLARVWDAREADEDDGASYRKASRWLDRTYGTAHK